jgi:four helix bundle protein
MNQESRKIKSFTDLNTWQEGHKLVLEIYQITQDFPKTEMFGLVVQMRRCAVSITSNIAEGFSRRSYREKSQFYSMALGSLTELQNQLLVAKDVNYMASEISQKLANQSVTINKLLNGLIKRSKQIHAS